LVAVVAHEVGHFRCGHILKSITVSIAVSGGLFWVLQSLATDSRLFDAFRILSVKAGSAAPLGLVLASIALGPVLRLTSFLSSAMSRKFEFEADAFAVQSYKKPRALASALKKLSVEHLSNLTPHPLKVALDYSHPPVLERVARLKG
jgi:STE24 endopeptidase